MTIAASAAFHAWFEANNFEWLLKPMALLAAFSAGLARGEPRLPIPFRIAGAAVLLGLSGWMLSSHGPSTWSLRETKLRETVEEALSGPRRDWRIMAYGMRPCTVLALMRVPFELIPEASVEQSQAAIAAAVEHSTVPTVVLLDRLVMSGMPWVFENSRSFRLPLDDVPETATVHHLRRDGLTCAIFFTPAGSTTAPAESR
jgi:hypothetical protein